MSEPSSRTLRFAFATVVENVAIRVRRERPPKSVSVVPGDLKVAWTYREGVVKVSVPRVEIRRVVVE